MRNCRCSPVLLNLHRKKRLPSTSNKIWRFILIGTLLVLIPVISSLLLSLNLVSGLEQSYFDEQLSQLESEKRDFLASLDAETVYKKHFQALAQKLLNLKNPEESLIRAIYTEFLPRLNNNYTLWFFDSQGKLAFSTEPDIDTNKGFDYIWRFAHEKSLKGEYSEFKKDFSRYLGRDFHPRQVKNSNDLCYPINNYSKLGLFYHFKSEADLSGILVFMPVAEDLSQILQEVAITKSNDQNPVITPEIMTNQGFQLPDGVRPDMPSEIFTLKPAEAFLDGGFLWQHVFTGKNQVLFGRRIEKNYFSLYKKIIWAMFLVLTLSGLGILYRSMICGQTIWISIRYKLIGIFIFAVYLPILGLFMVSFNGLANRQTAIENEVRKGIQDLLYKIDSDFSSREDEILAIFNRLYENISWHENLSKDWLESEEKIRQIAGVPLTGENFFNHLDVRDIRQKQLYSTNSGEANERIKEINRIIALICLEKFQAHRLPRQNLTKQSDLILKNMMENPVLGFTHHYERPGELMQMEFEGSSFYWYWNYYDRDDTNVAYFSGNTRVQYNVTDYLEKVLQKRLNLGTTGLKLAAFFPATKVWLPEGSEESPELQNLVKLAGVQNEVFNGKITFETQPYLATCLPGIKLKGAVLTCLYPESEITEKIRNMRHQILMGLIMILIISVFTGLLLTKTFLNPVGELNLGLTALRNRDTDFRVNIVNQDELGELGRTFNQMMEEVKEMLLAGAVQQCLIPREIPQIEGYESVIYNKMATDVGGDYADAFILPGERYLIVLGDVTGHGISSSILTAMVKAMVFRFASKNAPLPLILKSLSEMIFELMKYRKLMTFCAVILDRANNSFSLANAGHPFPFICRSSGEIERIEHAALPLGVSIKRSNYTLSEGKLEPGSILMMYTDGIAEGAGPDGEAFGFETIENTVKTHQNLSAEQISEILLSDFAGHYQKDALDDDLTFIMIKRKP